MQTGETIRGASTDSALEPQPSSADLTRPVVATEPRSWPADMAFLTGWLLPATTARHLARVTLPRAFLVHLISAGAVVVASVSILAWEGGATPSQFIGFVLPQIRLQIQRHRAELVMITCLAAFLVEAAGFLLALLIAAWGARDEKLRSSIRHAVRTVWLQSPHVCLSILLGLFISAALTRSLHAAYRHYDLPRWWVHRYNDEVILYCGLGLGLWAFWGMLRAVGARPVNPMLPPKPLCQECGYNLSGLSGEGRCPECGEPVAASIAPDARPGTAWERRRAIGLRRAWWRTSWQAIRHPYVLGRRLRLYSPARHHQRFLFTHMAAGMLFGLTCAVVWLPGALNSGAHPANLLHEFWGYVLPFWTLIGATAPLLITLLSAGLAGVWFSWTQPRNRLPAAMRVAAYLAGYLNLWAVYTVLGALAVGTVVARVWDEPINRRLGVDVGIAIVLFWLVSHVVWIWVYIRLLHLGLTGARHATK